MVDFPDLKPGVWVYRNLIKHQNDYWIYRISKVTEKDTFFKPIISLSKYSSGYFGSVSLVAVVLVCQLGQ
jgi:hypothetical protein